MTAEIDVFTHAYAQRQVVSGEAAELVLGADGRLESSWWRVGEQSWPAHFVEEISARRGELQIFVQDAGGARHGPWTGASLLGGWPEGALAFVFREAENDFWRGWSLAFAYGRLVAAPYEFDPS